MISVVLNLALSLFYWQYCGISIAAFCWRLQVNHEWQAPRHYYPLSQLDLALLYSYRLHWKTCQLPTRGQNMCTPFPELVLKQIESRAVILSPFWIVKIGDKMQLDLRDFKFWMNLPDRAEDCCPKSRPPSAPPPVLAASWKLLGLLEEAGGAGTPILEGWQKWRDSRTWRDTPQTAQHCQLSWQPEECPLVGLLRRLVWGWMQPQMRAGWSELWQLRGLPRGLPRWMAEDVAHPAELRNQAGELVTASLAPADAEGRGQGGSRVAEATGSSHCLPKQGWRKGNLREAGDWRAGDAHPRWG